MCVPVGPSTSPPKPPPAAQALTATTINTCTLAGLCRHGWFREDSGADAGGRNTRRSGADTAGPETYLEVLKGLLGRWGWSVAHHGGKDTDSGGRREFCVCVCVCFVLLFYLYFCFYFLIFFYFSIFILFFVVFFLFKKFFIGV